MRTARGTQDDILSCVVELIKIVQLPAGKSGRRPELQSMTESKIGSTYSHANGDVWGSFNYLTLLPQTHTQMRIVIASVCEDVHKKQPFGAHISLSDSCVCEAVCSS